MIVNFLFWNIIDFSHPRAPVPERFLDIPEIGSVLQEVHQVVPDDAPGEFPRVARPEMRNERSQCTEIRLDGFWAVVAEPELLADPFVETELIHVSRGNTSVGSALDGDAVRSPPAAFGVEIYPGRYSVIGRDSRKSISER